MGSQPRDEQALIDRSCAGDNTAYEALVRRHQATAFRTAYTLTRSAPDAEEAVQDGFVKAWGALEHFRAGSPFRPWLIAIVANEARTKVRARGRRRAWAARVTESAHTFAEASPSAESVAMARERNGDLRRALDRLSARDRTVIELRYLVDLSEQEAAAALGCRVGTVKSRLSRALIRLRHELGERP